MDQQNISDKWTTNESLLQSYRSIFISSQSLFISAAALTTNSWINIIIIAIAIFQLWIGFTTISARAKIVDYYKFQLSNQGVTVDEYIHNKTIRRNANKLIPGKTNWRKTRIKIDGWIPLSFFMLWLSFLTKYILDKC